MRSGPPVGPHRPTGMADAIAARTPLGLLGGKWVPLILVALATGPRRPKTLVHIVGNGVAKKVLIETLQRMESDQLLTRSGVYRNGQTEVRYTLTDRGRSLLPVVAGLARWAHADAQRPDGRPDPPAIQ
jgi:DNA-binding HxlR family transcriptional regulator